MNCHFRTSEDHFKICTFLTPFADRPVSNLHALYFEVNCVDFALILNKSEYNSDGSRDRNESEDFMDLDSKLEDIPMESIAEFD